VSGNVKKDIQIFLFPFESEAAKKEKKQVEEMTQV